MRDPKSNLIRRVAFGQPRITNANNVFFFSKKIVHEFVPMCRSQDRCSPNFLLKGENKRMLLQSRGKRDRETTILRVTLKPGDYDAALKCGIREKGAYKIRIFLPLNLQSGKPWLGYRRVWKSLSETSYSRSVSTCKRDLSPEAMKTPDAERQPWMRNERISQRRHTKGKSTLFRRGTSATI